MHTATETNVYLYDRPRIIIKVYNHVRFLSIRYIRDCVDRRDYRVYHKPHDQRANNMHGTYNYYYCIVKSRFGEVTIVWRWPDKKVVRVFLPRQRDLFKSSVYNSARVLEKSDRNVWNICAKMSSMLQGRPTGFSLDNLDWSATYPFQQRVLRMEQRIARGMVSTYGRLGSKLGHPRAARAVGTALARNPFPLIIPCHRAVRSDRSLGGYAGGLAMKRKLLELEGVEFDQHGRAMNSRFW